jgi:fatty-acyl-CoA synthase
MRTLPTRVKDAAFSLKTLTEAGIVRPYSPVVLVKLLTTLRQWSTVPAGGFKTLALRAPDRVGLIDDVGSLTWSELHVRSNALAHGLRGRGVRTGDSVAIMCRNHRGFIEASLAASKIGADVLYMNTAFAGPQLAEVIEREKPRVVVHDEEFTELLAGADIDERVIAWTDGEPGPEATGRRSCRPSWRLRSGPRRSPDRAPRPSRRSRARRCRRRPAAR